MSDDTYSFPYHYDEEADAYTFYRIPKVLFVNPVFQKLSCEAKLLYGLLLDRMQLSMRNHWLDENGRVFIYFAQEHIAEMLGCSMKKVGSLLAELDSKKGIGLITRKRQGLGKPDKIYVRKCISPDITNRDFQTRQNDRSGSAKVTNPDETILQGKETDMNDTEKNEIEYHSFSSMNARDGPEVKMMERDQYRDLVMDHIDYQYLVMESRASMLDEIVELMVDVICSEQEFIWIGRDRKPLEVVKSQFLKLDCEHIRFVLHCLSENTSKVVNIRQYLLTVLYNAPLTISNYYSALVQHDMYGE